MIFKIGNEAKIDQVAISIKQQYMKFTTVMNNQLKLDTQLYSLIPESEKL